MNKTRKKSGALKHTPLVFLLVMAVLLVALGWLGWLLLEQDRVLQHQRTQTRIEAAADTLAQALLTNVDEEFGRLQSLIPALQTTSLATLDFQGQESLTVYFEQDSFIAVPEQKLL